MKTILVDSYVRYFPTEGRNADVTMRIHSKIGIFVPLDIKRSRVICPYCNSGEVRLVFPENSRRRDTYHWQCRSCGRRFDSPRQNRAMEILRMPLRDLQDRIEMEMNENPLLELGEYDSDEFPAEESDDYKLLALEGIVVEDTQDDAIAARFVPDLIVEQQGDGEYRVILGERQTPRLRTSSYYRERLNSPEVTPEERELIKRKLKAARLIIASINRRNEILLKVARVVIEYQSKFLRDGPEYLEPVNVQQIADRLGIHATTESRAIENKWLQTPHGMFPLPRLVEGGKQASIDDPVWDIVRDLLQSIIESEDRDNPFTDEELAKQLSSHGLNVAGLAVAWYRREFGIPEPGERRDKSHE